MRSLRGMCEVWMGLSTSQDFVILYVVILVGYDLTACGHKPWAHAINILDVSLFDINQEYL